MAWKHPRALPKGQLDLYVVEWPRRDFVKVGVTKNQRWRNFQSRGGQPLLVLRLPSMKALAIERYVHDTLSGRLACPFSLPRAAERYLGSGGGGYTECYEDDGGEVMPVVLEAASRLGWPYERVTC